MIKWMMQWNIINALLILILINLKITFDFLIPFFVVLDEARTSIRENAFVISVLLSLLRPLNGRLIKMN